MDGPHLDVARSLPAAAADSPACSADSLCVPAVGPLPVSPPADETKKTQRRTRTTPCKTVSERSRSYRARKKSHEQLLKIGIAELRDEIARLYTRKQLAAEHSISTRLSASGPLACLVLELFKTLAHGIPWIGGDDPSETSLSVASSEFLERRRRLMYQQHFLHKALDPDVLAQGVVGVPGFISQWQWHTASYARHLIAVDEVPRVVGPVDDPTVVVHTYTRVRFSRATFQILFPGGANKEWLIQKLLGREFAYTCVTRFRFSPEGRIKHATVDFGYVTGLMALLQDPQDVAELMEGARILPQVAIGDEKSYLQAEQRDPGSSTSVGDAGRSSGDRLWFSERDSSASAAPARMNLECILDSDDDEGEERWV